MAAQAPEPDRRPHDGRLPGLACPREGAATSGAGPRHPGGMDRSPVTAPAYIADRATAFLPPRSEIKQVFVSRTAPHFVYFLAAYLFSAFVKVSFRCVAVTDDAIYVMDGTRSSGGARPTRLLGVMRRSTRFEPAAGLFWTR